MHLQARLAHQITIRSPFGSPSGSPQACQCAHRPYSLPLGSLLYLRLTMHLQAQFTYQINFQFPCSPCTCKLGSPTRSPCARRPFSSPLCSSGLALDRARQLSDPMDHLSAHRLACSVQAQRTQEGLHASWIVVRLSG